MQRWNITRTLYKVSDFLSWQRSGTLELSPSFQRRPVWNASAKSFLIDTMVRGLPIPIIFIREQTDLSSFEPKRQIVDGQQRIRTVLSYIDAKSLKDYKKERDFFRVRRTHNTELADKDFRDLPQQIKKELLDYQFSVHILPSDVDDKQVLQIFARMNATGVKLNAQELRNAEFFGIFKKTMYELAYEQLERWRNWGIFSENQIARMGEVEMTSDLTLLMYKGITSKDKKALDNLYKDRDDEFKKGGPVMERFRTIMDSIGDKLGKDLRNLEFRKKTLFYVLFALCYDIQYGLGSRLVKCSKKQLPRDFGGTVRALSQAFLTKKVPEKVAEVTTRRTSIVTSRRILFKYVKEKATGG